MGVGHGIIQTCDEGEEKQFSLIGVFGFIPVKEKLNAQILGNFFCQLNVETYDGILSINQCVELVGRIVGRSSQDNLSRCLDFFQ